MIPSSKNLVSAWTANVSRSLLKIAVASAFVLGTASPSFAADGFPPNLMSYQGYLVDANGAALAPTTPVNYSVVFRVYAVSTAGTSLWTESQTVTVDKGNFSVVLGEGGAEVLDHAVAGGAELAEFVGTVVGEACGEVTAGDLIHGAAEGVDASEDAAADQEHTGSDGGDGDAADREHERG